MNLQNGTLDTRLPQNIIRNFEIPTNIEYDRLNPFKIGGGNAIWATYFPPNVKVWFSTTPNFDSAQRLDYMNRGMRFNAIGSDGLQQQYDNFYIFTEGKWDDVVKIAVSSQGDMVEPILSSNTGDIDSVGRVASIMKMPVNGASGYNEPDFAMYCRNKYAANFLLNDLIVFYQKFEYTLLNFLHNKNYLFEIDQICFPSNMGAIGGDNVKNITPSIIAIGFAPNDTLVEWNSSDKLNTNLTPVYPVNNLKDKIGYNFYEILARGFFPLGICAVELAVNMPGGVLNNTIPKRIIVNGSNIKNKIPVVLISTRGTFNGYFDFNIRIYSL